MSLEGSFLWREVTFVLKEHSVHSGFQRFESEGSTWRVVRYRNGDGWYARLKLCTYRETGQGSTHLEALDAVYEAALAHQRELRRALRLVPLKKARVPRALKEL
jgi:hypothetical protein